MSEAAMPAPEAPSETKPPKRRLTRKLMTLACILALVGIAVSLAHFLWPTPLLFSLFMTVGQGSFGAGILLYFAVIILDLKRSKVL